VGKRGYLRGGGGKNPSKKGTSSSTLFKKPPKISKKILKKNTSPFKKTPRGRKPLNIRERLSLF